MATDGVADRTGAMDGGGQFVGPRRIMALALRYLVEKRRWRGKVVKTFSVTQRINHLAAKYGPEALETPVGFNCIADNMPEENVPIGGEESGGMSFHGQIPEGDGVLMGLLIEMAHPCSNPEITERPVGLPASAPGGMQVERVQTADGGKRLPEDESWLLIRPSGTEPAPRVHAGGRGEKIARGCSPAAKRCRQRQSARSGPLRIEA
jgi:phosphomannomutase